MTRSLAGEAFWDIFGEMGPVEYMGGGPDDPPPGHPNDVWRAAHGTFVFVDGQWRATLR